MQPGTINIGAILTLFLATLLPTFGRQDIASYGQRDKMLEKIVAQMFSKVAYVMAGFEPRTSGAGSDRSTH